MVNNSANYRDNCFEARELVEADKLGDIHHVMCCMYSPLMGLFDDPANVRPVTLAIALALALALALTRLTLPGLP